MLQTGQPHVQNGQKLKDVLLDLGRKYQVSILFEEATINGMLVSNGGGLGTKLEQQLETLLAPNGLEFKKSGKKAYLIRKKDLKVKSDETPVKTTFCAVGPAN